ncbi:MAG: formate dehydrogenase accessory sulfurtransferase FdhD [Thermodesulfobacteriota bacterium]|nr:formate dehydrogenase accessory sulfurtransferase FdhD [Thermodesulfobacteriota bacterium]
MDILKFPAIQMKKGKVMNIVDDICVEETFHIYLNDELLADIVASPAQLKELGAGLVVCEGLVDNVKDIDAVDVSQDEIRVYAKTHGSLEKRVVDTGGGISIGEGFKRVRSSLVIKKDNVFKIISQIESDVWKRTGGVHSSVLFSNKRLVARSIDIGRHNTIDKVIGFTFFNDIDLSRCVIGCTGRQPAGMVVKVANAGVPIVISRAPSTDKGIHIADKAGITLICFAREGRFTVYTHPHRVYKIGIEAS